MPLCLCPTQPPGWACLLRFILWLLELVPKVDYAIKFREEVTAAGLLIRADAGAEKRLRGRERLRVSKLTSTCVYDRTGQRPV